MWILSTRELKNKAFTSQESESLKSGIGRSSSSSWFATLHLPLLFSSYFNLLLVCICETEGCVLNLWWPPDCVPSTRITTPGSALALLNDITWWWRSNFSLLFFYLYTYLRDLPSSRNYPLNIPTGKLAPWEPAFLHKEEDGHKHSVHTISNATSA